MNAILLLFSLSLPPALAQNEISFHVTYEAGTRSHRVCGTPENTNALIRQQDIGEIDARATLHWKTTTTEAVAVQIDEIEGLGRSPLWDRLYNSPLTRSERIEALKDAILGIGNATAPHVLPYFYGPGVRKARTWKDFSARIRDAGSEIEYRSCRRHELPHCIRASSWVPMVLNRYAAENRAHLGYTREQITGLRTVTRTEEHSRAAPERDHTLRYAIQFTGFKLLPGECEVVTVRYSELGIDGKMETAYNYAEATPVSERVEGRDALILVTGQGRRVIGAPRGLARVSTRGETVTIEKSDALADYGINREFSALCRLEARIQISAVENTSWYDWGGKTRSLGLRTFLVTPNAAPQTETLGPVVYNADRESLRTDSTVSFASGCPYFNSRPL